MKGATTAKPKPKAASKKKYWVPQESVSVSLTVLALVFQQAVVCDMVCFFFFLSFQLKNALQSFLERICIVYSAILVHFSMLFLINAAHMCEV